MAQKIAAKIVKNKGDPAVAPIFFVFVGNYLPRVLAPLRLLELFELLELRVELEELELRVEPEL